MITLVTHFRVRDYDAWKPVFDDHEDLRRGHRGLGYRIYRDIHDPGRVVVHNDFPSEQDAKSFSEDPRLRAAMERGGVEGEPGFGLLERVEEKAYTVGAAA
jgi:quinol monooxygenase YgiN